MTGGAGLSHKRGIVRNFRHTDHGLAVFFVAGHRTVLSRATDASFYPSRTVALLRFIVTLAKHGHVTVSAYGIPIH